MRGRIFLRVCYLVGLGLLLSMGWGVRAQGSGLLGRVATSAPGEQDFPSASGLPWVIELVETVETPSEDISLALDTTGRPHISYVDRSYSANQSLRYAYYDGSTWQVETVDSALGLGSRYNSLALDSAGRPHIAYLYAVKKDLRYARFDGASWITETVDSPGDVGRDASLALDSAGRPHICYYDATHENVRHARFDGTSWITETLDTAVGGLSWHIGLALDSADRPHVSYYDDDYPSGGHLKYAYYDGVVWQIEAVDSGDLVGIYSSLTLDSAERPHISYYSVAADAVKYAHYDGATWQVDKVKVLQNSCDGTSIAVDGFGRPHLVYTDYHKLDLMYAYYDGYNWQIEAVDGARDVPSLALDPNGLPHIGYRHGTDVKYAYCPECVPIDQVSIHGPAAAPANRATMYSATVVPTGATSPRFSWDNGMIGSAATYLWPLPGVHNLAVTATNLCTEGVYQTYTVTVFPQPVEGVEVSGPGSLPAGHSGLYAAAYMPPTASLPVTITWDNGTVGDTAAYSWSVPGRYSPTVTATNPYAQVSGTFPVEVFCQPVEEVAIEGPSPLLLNQVGTYEAGFWPITTSPPITVTWDNGTIGSSATYSWDVPGKHTLTVTVANPCGEVRAIFDVTVLPIAWYIEVVDGPGDVGMFTSLVLDASGFPHISYYAAGSSDLRYAYMDRTNWQIETVDSDGAVGQYTSLDLDSVSLPHISYYDATHRDLKYARYDGSTWVVETVDSSGDVGLYSSLALDAQDYPHIGYYDATNEDLKYAYYDGVAWQVETVQSNDDVGQHTSLALDATGRPHISYRHCSPLSYCSLGYAWYDGTSWDTSIVDTGGGDMWGVGYYTSLALDNTGRRYVSYYAWYWYRNPPPSPWPGFPYTDYCVKYAWSDGENWQIQTVEARRDFNIGTHTSLALDASGQPRVSYCSGVNANLKYAWFNGQIWTVDNSTDAGRWNSLALDAMDWPHISYYANGVLKHAYLCSLLQGVNVQGPLALLVGQEGTYRANPQPITASLPLDFVWDNGTAGPTTRYSWTMTGTYTLTVGATNPCGQGQATYTVRVLEEWPYHFFLPLISRSG